MSPDVLPHIFEPCTQADRTLDRSQGGLGIGLALVRQLVDLHGGTVTAASPGLGLGAEFTVRLPAVANLAEEEHELRGGPARPEAKGARILVVDDNEDSTRAIARLLKASGHEVWTAFDGKAAIEAARSHRPDVVLLDIGLPLMDGYQVAATLRRDEAFKETLIVAASGYGQDQDRRKSKEAGFDHHLTKPIDFAELFELTSRYLDGRVP
jgi:CheY-like chemotaxis protein